MNGERVKGSRVPKVLIVDDHLLIREGLKAVIVRDGRFKVCGEASMGAEVPSLVRTLKPEVLILDLSLPDVDGLDLVSRVHGQFASLAILVVSGRDEKHFAERCLRAGARGFLPKGELGDQLDAAMTRILKGDLYVTPLMASRFLANVARQSSSAKSGVESLTNRELELLQRLGQGESSRSVAERWCRSLKTVETYRENLKRKLRLSSAAELVYYAVLWGQNHSRTSGSR